MTFNSRFHQLFSPFSKKVMGGGGERNNGKTETENSQLARLSLGWTKLCVLATCEVSGSRYH